MKKQILSTILLSGLVLAVGAVNASAADAIVENNVVKSEKTFSDVEVKLVEEDGNKPGEGPFLNNLAIAWVPKLYSFSGSTTDNELILENTNAAKEQQAVTVNDDRQDKTKWTLSAQLSKLETAGGEALSSKMVIKTDGTLKRYDIGDKYFDAANNRWDLEHKQIDHSALDDDSGLYDLKQNFDLPADGQTTVTVIEKTAAEDPTGDNKNGVTAYVGDASLVMAAGSAKTEKKGDYTGKLVWTVAAQ